MADTNVAEKIDNPVVDDTAGTDEGANQNTGDVAPKADKPAGNESGTFLDDKADDATDEGADKAAPVENWRDRIAAGDAKFRKQLDRFGSEADFGKSYREAEKLKGQIKAPLPENPTAEQLAAYRKDNGIPETPDKYEVKLPDGLVIGEAEKPMVGEFLKTMHDKNAPPALVNEALSWYYQTQDAQAAAAKQADQEQRQETITELRNEWGPEYKASTGMIKAWMDRQPDGVGDVLASARDSNGRAVLNNPSFVKWLNNHIRETDPSATVLHDAAMSGVSVKERMEAIQKIIRDEPGRYYKGEEGARLQEELARLGSIEQ